MLQLSSTLYNVPIMSLRTGGPVGNAIAPIINPNNLKIEGWYAQDIYSKEQLILPEREIRDIIPKGFVVNDHDAMTHRSDLVRMEKILRIKFELITKNVVSENGKKLGKVQDFAYDSNSFYVQKLYVMPTLLKSIKGDQIIIGRTQIINITDKKIVVSDPTVPVSAPAGAFA